MDAEKRRSIRIVRPLAVQFGIKNDSATSWDMSLIRDISETGICLRTGALLNKDDICYLRFKMPTHPNSALEITAKVIESVPSRANTFTTRLEFLNMDKSQLGAIREYAAWALMNEGGKR